jgi:hypothetical protein
VWNHVPAELVAELAYKEQRIAYRVCHIVDENDRALCFANLAGLRIHSPAECRAGGHSRCVTCTKLRDELDGWES